MPEVVRGHADPGLVASRRQDALPPPVRQRLAELVHEQRPNRRIGREMGLELVEDHLADGDAAARRLRLQGGDLAVLQPLAIHPDRSGEEVDVVHPQPACLADPDPGACQEDDQSDPPVLDRVHHRRDLVDSRRDDLLVITLREADLAARRMRDDAVVHRGCEDAGRHVVDVPDRPGRQPLAFEVANEALEQRRADGSDGVLTERRQQMKPERVVDDPLGAVAGDLDRLPVLGVPAEGDLPRSWVHVVAPDH
ncbi:hypothetical protein SAMN05421872_110227 [Nocardioides lianchengensis]|uniref:Uncharacterized protein n=1 Tax=Nocardioides lianchengensis TaxID=1045774 RepID=A0A1G6XD38_9ACTN|nr:hypothetical protein SAMN05421872_110227 [Nocardioides lianchengensis]